MLLAKQFGDDDESGWDDVTKDRDEIAVSSGGMEVSGATKLVKHVMNRITW
jgi:hypothetical protein